MSATPARGRHGLRATCLSFPEVLSQSVANISPTLTPVIIVPLVFASAGEGTWLAYLVATVGLGLVGSNVNQFTRRSATPGSLYAFVTRGLGVTILNDLSTISTFGFLIAYVLVSIAAPLYLRRIGQLSLSSVVCAALSVAFMAPPLIASVYPAPAAPADKFPLYFLIYLAAGLVWYTVLRTRTSATVVQRIRADLELDSAGLAGD